MRTRRQLQRKKVVPWKLEDSLCSASVIIIFTPVQRYPVDELLENLEARRPVEAGVISIDRLSIIDWIELIISLLVTMHMVWPALSSWIRVGRPIWQKRIWKPRGFHGGMSLCDWPCYAQLDTCYLAGMQMGLQKQSLIPPGLSLWLA